MKRLCLSTALVCAVPALATASAIEDRVEALERQQAELYHTLEGRTEAGLGSRIAEHLSLSGLVEIEGGFQHLRSDDDAKESTSDLVLATVQLGFEAEIQEHLAATVILLYEEEEDAVIEVDEATLDYTRGLWGSRIGRQYVPFGLFPSHMISDPLTLNLGETRETAVLIGYGQDRFRTSLWAANGDAEHHDGAGHLNDWGASVAVRPTDYSEFGASFLSDLADTDAELVANYQDRVPGWSAYAVFGLGAVQIHGEMLGAVTRFHEDDLDHDSDGTGDRPLAWNVEVAVYPWETLEVALRWEGSEEFAGEPELQYGACVSWGPWESVSTSLEYLRGEFDADFGDGVDSRDLVTAQLAVEF